MSGFTYANAGAGAGNGESSQSGGILQVFTNMTIDKKTAEGKQPKRRGPKPDSKPATNRRQELNRQAQRTHRERKEQYTKACEIKVNELISNSAADKMEINYLKSEITRLHELLVSNGIPIGTDVSTPYTQPSMSGSVSGHSYGPASTTITVPSPVPQMPMQLQSPQGYQYPNQPNGNNPTHYYNGQNGMVPIPANGLDYNSIGIDFVLALERPCMKHMQMLCVRSHNADEHMSGHALMATCPPTQHIIENPNVPYPHQIPKETAGGDLLRLLDLSGRLDLNGELTPVMAWAYIMRDENMPRFTKDNFAHIQEVLMGKVRCYGFGACMEDFEVQDAIDDVTLNFPESCA